MILHTDRQVTNVLLVSICVHVFDFTNKCYITSSILFVLFGYATSVKSVYKDNYGLGTLSNN